MTAESPTTPPVLASATARAWLARLHALQMLRAQFVDAPDFQRWVIQARVLEFLLNTHASDPLLDNHPLPSPPSEPWFQFFGWDGKPPRTAEEIRPVLQAIAAGNVETRRRREAEALREVQQQLEEHARNKIEAERIRAYYDLDMADNVEELQNLWRYGNLDIPETPIGGPIEAVWTAADSARGKRPLVWPTVPSDFVGLCVAGPLDINTVESIATILDFHLQCGHDQALAYAHQLQTIAPLAIATDQMTACWLASDLRGIGLQAMASV